MADNDPAAADDEQESEAPIAVGNRYQLTDDGTVFEVVGLTDDEVDVVQYTDSGERQGEYTTAIEEFRTEIAEPAQ